MSFEIRILCFDQDDPKKCTAKRLDRFQLSSNYKTFKTLPPRGIVLDPFSDKTLNKSDSILAEVSEAAVDSYSYLVRECIQRDRGVSIPDCPVGCDFDIGDDYSFGKFEAKYDL